MKGIILAGGKGTRLYPNTTSVSKQLLPIYDKPTIYYPLSTLMLAGIKKILLISSRDFIENYRTLLSDGSDLGINISYEIQEKPNGILESLLIGEEFVGNDNFCLILGDNFFYGQELTSKLESAMKKLNGVVIFAYPVNNPEDYGVITFDNTSGKPISIIEKPSSPGSKYIIPGIYFYENSAIQKAKTIKPSLRGELEITSLNQYYLDLGRLSAVKLGRGFTWIDTGTVDMLKSASDFVEVIQTHQGYYVACIEEVAWRKGYIDISMLVRLYNKMPESNYKRYLKSIIERYTNE
jgi:glucose-1-phosphate thymidylyltransferase